MSALISVGIDIGTTTTHMVVSRLTLGNLSKPTEIGRLGITDKKILFSSPIYLTPLTGGQSIDAVKTAKLLSQMFALAPVTKFDSGAVIITGESAAKRNAESVLKEIAELAGDFVVESAGAALESIYCARGSGARAWSEVNRSNVLNIDIGGGTSNFALIEEGEIVLVDVVHAGGRAVRLEEGKISSLSQFAAEIIERKKLCIKVGDAAQSNQTIADLARLARDMCQAIVEKAVEMQKTFLSRSGKKIDLLYFSGGVAALMQGKNLERNAERDPAGENSFFDLGGELANAVFTSLYKDEKTNPEKKAGWPTREYKIADDPIRATVLGAGMHALQLSGSTIGIDGEGLPLKNLPLIKINGADPQLIPTHIRQALAQKELDWSKEKIAIALCGLTRQDLQYESMKKTAQQLAFAFRDESAISPLVVICDHDVAMALAQLLKRTMPDKRIITVDGIAVQDGDYLDIGKPVNRLSDPNTVTLPVIVKTLVFYKN